MDPESQFYLEVFKGVAVGLFFVVLGAIVVIVSLGNLNVNGRLLFAGGGCIVLGVIIAWRYGLQYTRPLKPKTKTSVFVCSRCSAIVEEDAECCPKCGKTVADQPNNS